jgi:hypothetical protein
VKKKKRGRGRPALDDTTKSLDQAGLIRKQTSRKKLGKRPPPKNPVLEAEYSTPPLEARQAIEVLLGPVTEDLEEEFLRIAMRFREKKVKPRRAKYIRRRYYPRVDDVDCINSFLREMDPPKRSCYCIGKRCPRRDK